MKLHIFQPIMKGLAVLSTLALSLSLASCGNLVNPTPEQLESDPNKGSELKGVKAEGKLGEKPKVTFRTPMKFSDKASAILQEGDGESLKDGDRLCVQSIAISAKDGKELDSTWEKGHADCQIIVNKKSYPAYYDQFIKMKVHGTIAVGVNDDTSSNNESNSYIMVLTVVSKSKSLTRATGEAVKNIPSYLPKVTLAENGQPHLDMNNFKPDGKLISQTLIKGDGAVVKRTQTVSVKYTGWLAADGKQFDTSWDKEDASDFSLEGVVKGWQEGLAGQTIGSQVLLVIPPDLAYGDKLSHNIPANSTLIFVVDILSAY